LKVAETLIVKKHYMFRPTRTLSFAPIKNNDRIIMYTTFYT